MGPTVEELNKVLEIKNNIKQSIINKGVEVADNTNFADYPAKIDSIESGDSESVWNMITNNWTRGDYLFYFCKSLTELDVSNWDTSKVTNMQYMFYNCQSLTSLDVSNWVTSAVTNMSSMFYYCIALTELDLSNWDTSKVTTMTYMFYNCNKLTTIGDVSNWDTRKVTDINNMFANCKSLTSLDCSNWDVGHITAYFYIQSAFDNCPALVDFKAPQNINANMSFKSSQALSHDSLMSIINNLKTVTSTKTLELGATNLAKLSSDEIAIATNKGWTVK